MVARTAPVPKAPREETIEEKRAAIRDSMQAAERLARIKGAREDVIDFTSLTMPDPGDPDNPAASRYVAKRHHQALAKAVQEVIKGNILRLLVVFPPRHGKSEITSRRLPAWVMGVEPYWEIILATYNEEFAQDFGRDVRDIVLSQAYKQIFPGTTLKKGSKAADRLENEQGGAAYFVGRGGSLTGRGGDLLIADDLLKDRKEADSKTIRDDCWKWFWDVFMSRMKDDGARCILINTRWHEDDVVGRLTDPKNPAFDPDEAAKWHILDLPALAYEGDVLGRKPGEALWPEKFGVPYLHGIKKINPKGFASLYQGRPAPEEGNFFKTHMLTEYGAKDLPAFEHMRFYGGSDHAVSTKQENDATALVPVGVDEHDHLWVMPDVFWRRVPTDVSVEAMIDLMERYRFLTWWAEDEHISKSIGPFLRKRMLERKVFVSIEPSSAAADKKTRAQAIQARMSMGMVHFPRFAPWWGDAKEQLLKFPDGTHDDFVDALSHVGRGLGRLVAGKAFRPKPSGEPVSGTIHWIKWAHAQEQRLITRRKTAGGM